MLALTIQRFAFLGHTRIRSRHDHHILARCRLCMSQCRLHQMIDRVVNICLLFGAFALLHGVGRDSWGHSFALSATRLSALYWMHLILSHSKYAKLSQLSWTEHSLWWQLIRIDGLHTPLLGLALCSHLLIGHDVLHYHVFVFFPDSLV